MTLFNSFSNKLLAFSERLSKITYITIIKDTFTLLMPLVIAGALCTLFSNVVTSTTTLGPSLANIQGLSFLEVFAPVFSAINYASLNFFAIAVALLVGSQLGKKRGLNSAVCAIIAVSSYIIVCITSITVYFKEETQIINNVLSSEYTGAKGLFLAITIGIISVELFTKLIACKKLEIKMPDMVPPNVALSFRILFPAMITLLIISICEFLIMQVTGEGVFTLIYTVLQEPLSSVVTGLPGVLLLMLCSQLFWIIGIHGNQIIQAIRDPLLTAALLTNTEAFDQRKELPFIVNQSFWYVFMQNGGSGCTLGLIIAIFLVSKREDYRTISKLSLMPGVFGINETMTFGLPIVLNPIMAIPFIITPLVCGIIGYVATAMGFAGKMMYAVPWTTPPLVNGWLASGGDLGVIVTQAICIIISVIMYIPFVYMLNKQTNITVE